MHTRDTLPNPLPELSIVVPMYNEEAVIDFFFQAVLPIAASVAENFEIVCVNDGSRDRTLRMLEEHRSRDPRIKIVDLSRNFGKESALSAGLDFATGRAVVPMDADLQDPPEVLQDLVAKWREGFDMVLAVRNERKTDTFLKRLTAKYFYNSIGMISDIVIPANAGDFRLLDRKVVDALKLMPERSRFMKGLFAWLGYRQATVYYARPARAAGTTKFNYWRLWNFALEGIISFSSTPLKIWSYFGFFVAALSILYMFFIIVRTLLWGIDVPGYASLMVAVLLMSGLNMIGLGVLGEYLSRIFTEVKQRPLYLVQRAYGFKDNDGSGS